MTVVARRIARRGVVVGLALGAGVTVACSLTVDLSGFSLPVEADAAFDAPADAPIDAFEAGVDSAPPPCVPERVIDTPLTTSLETWSGRSFSLGGYPKVEGFEGTTAAVLLPFVDQTPVPIDAGDPDAGPTFYTPPGHQGAHSGIWQTSAVPLRSFDVTYDLFVKCSSSSSCADGAAFAWLDTTDPLVLTNKSAGHIMGFPPGVSGAAVIADIYQNGTSDTSDPPVPAVEIVKIDGAKSLGHYAWVVASKGKELRAAWHTFSISVRGADVAVRVDGASLVSSKVLPLNRGLVGISAGTGGQTEAVAVRNVKASFYDCTP